MNAFILLADAGSTHQDGTFSLLRAGIDKVVAPEEPIFFEGVVAIRIRATLSEAGPHTFSIKCIDQDGKAALPPISGGFTVPELGGGANLMVKFGFAFPKIGRYQFALLIDDQEQDQWGIEATKTPHKETSS